MLLNQGMSFHERLGSMNDWEMEVRLNLLLERHKMDTDANRAGDTLVLFDILLTFLNLSASITNKLHSHILLATTELRGINGDKESFDASLLGVLNIFLRNFSVAVNIAGRMSGLTLCVTKYE